jgi:hypothetical protein
MSQPPHGDPPKGVSYISEVINIYDDDPTWRSLEFCCLVTTSDNSKHLYERELTFHENSNYTDHPYGWKVLDRLQNLPTNIPEILAQCSWVKLELDKFQRTVSTGSGRNGREQTLLQFTLTSHGDHLDAQHKRT